jgi:hypothetical protein
MLVDVSSFKDDNNEWCFALVTRDHKGGHRKLIFTTEDQLRRTLSEQFKLGTAEADHKMHVAEALS